jgi:chromosome partitioning protein
MVAKKVAKKVSVINMKRGVGKSTLSIHLARYLSEHEGKKVLLIDLDPQANASIVGIDETVYANHKSDPKKKTIAGLFIEVLKQFGPFSKKENLAPNINDYRIRVFESQNQQGYLDIIPSELALSSILRGISLNPYELNRLLIDRVEKQYDFIIIDCAPTYSVLTTLALNATKAIVIPMIADFFGIHGTKQMIEVLEEHDYDYGEKIEIVGVVFTLWKKRSNAEQTNYLNQIIAEWKLWNSAINIFDTKIIDDKKYKVINGQQPHQNPPGFDNFVHEFLLRMEDIVS